MLPRSIVIKDITEEDENFDSRKSAKSKVYRYVILNRNSPSALFHRLCWHIPLPSLNLEAMKEASKFLLGEHDFSSFRASDCDAFNPVRTVYNVSLEKKEEGFIHFEIEANAFLKHMVRIIVGTLVDVGKSKISVKDFKKLIELKDRTKAGMTAPAWGLFLVRVNYY